MLNTTTHTFAGPLDGSDTHAVAELRRILQSHDFAGASFRKAVGGALPIGKFHYRDDLPLYLRRLAAPTPLNTLIKLFVLDQWVDEADVREALAPLAVADVRTMGLIEEGPRGIRARARLSGWMDLIIAHDRYDEETGTLSEDHVLDVNPTTVKLANFTVRRPVRTALDMGTGCGALALLAARHAEHVIAVDINPRALNFAAFNALLNGFSNIECRQGSLFEPVRGERFDLVVCNPPYVISPETRYVFRDGGRRGDSFSEEVVRTIPEHLEEGGFAAVLCNWALHDEDDAADPPRRWVQGSGCDAWIVYSSTPDPLTYAGMWTRSRDRAAYERGLERWLGYFAELNVTAIGQGAVILRRRTAEANWIRADEAPDGPSDSADAHIQRIFYTQDLLAAAERDEQLLEYRFVAVADHRLRQTLVLRDNEYVPERADIALEGGMRFSGGVDPYTIHLLARCDGTRSLAAIAEELAEKGGMERAHVAQACAAIARHLAALGFLIPSN
jgi:methylase of polypeptide subunit release factors